jgi:hypothetical protein
MTDADSLSPADAITTLADALNAAMANDETARIAYARLWGTEWSALTSATGSTVHHNTRSVSSEASTVAR